MAHLHPAAHLTGLVLQGSLLTWWELQPWRLAGSVAGSGFTVCLPCESRRWEDARGRWVGWGQGTLRRMLPGSGVAVLALVGTTGEGNGHTTAPLLQARAAAESTSSKKASPPTQLPEEP